MAFDSVALVALERQSAMGEGQTGRAWDCAKPAMHVLAQDEPEFTEAMEVR